MKIIFSLLWLGAIGTHVWSGVDAVDTFTGGQVRVVACRPVVDAGCEALSDLACFVVLQAPFSLVLYLETTLYGVSHAAIAFCVFVCFWGHKLPFDFSGAPSPDQRT